MTEQAKGYPVILGGDHAEFERQHANTPPKERPDWPLPSFDARDWAVAFCKIAKTDGLEIDEAWMQTWFSNALMRGFDEQTGRVAAEIARLRAERDQLLAAAKNVRKLIAEAAMTGFNYKDGDWAERLYASQQDTSAAVASVEAQP